MIPIERKNKAREVLKKYLADMIFEAWCTGDFDPGGELNAEEIEYAREAFGEIVRNLGKAK